MSPEAASPRSQSVWKLFFFTMLGLTFAYGSVEMGSALWAPTVTLDDLSARIGAALDAEITIDRGTFDPMTGRAEIEGLTIEMREPGVRTARLEVERVVLDVVVGSLFDAGIIIDELTLQAPVLTYVREGKGRIKRPEESPEDRGPPPTLVIRSLEVEDGAFVFEDRVLAPIPLRVRFDGATVSGHDLSPTYPLSLLTRTDVTAGPLRVENEHRGGEHEGPEAAGGPGADRARYSGFDLSPLGKLTGPLPVGLVAASAEVELDLAPDGESGATLSGHLRLRGMHLAVRDGTPLAPMLKDRLAPLLDHLSGTGGELDVPFELELASDELRGYFGDVLRNIAIQVGVDLLHRLRKR